MYKLLKWKICFSLRVMLVRFLNHCDSTPVLSRWLTPNEVTEASCTALHNRQKIEREWNTSVFSSCFQSFYRENV